MQHSAVAPNARLSRAARSYAPWILVGLCAIWIAFQLGREYRTKASAPSAPTLEQRVVSNQSAPIVTTHLPLPNAGLAPDVNPQAMHERYRAKIAKLEAQFAADPKNSLNARTDAETLRNELTLALNNRGRVSDAQCVPTFCRAICEEDLSAGREFDTAKLISATPSLARETMFDYQREAAKKTTIIYVARPGATLPIR